MNDVEIKKRGKEFFDVKFEKSHSAKYIGTVVKDDVVLVHYSYAYTGDLSTNAFKVLPEEFNSENGIEMFKKRLVKQKVEYLQSQSRLKKLQSR